MAANGINPAFRGLSGSGRTAGAASYAVLKAQCLGMARRRAALAGLSSLIPIPGIDLLTDVALLMSVIEEVSRRYGLTAKQIEALSPNRKALAFRLTTSAGGFLAARLTASQTFALILRRAGLRLGVMEASRLAPIVGQITAVLISYFTLTWLARKHIEECESITAQLDSAQIV